MTTVERERTIAAPVADVWKVLADFAGISAWAPNVDHACAMSDRAGGVGATRRVQTGRTTLIETVAVWQPESILAYEIAGLPTVVRSVVTRWTLTAHVGTGDVTGSTDVTVRTEVDAGRRPPRRLVAEVVARKFAAAAEEMLAGLAEQVEGTRVS